MILILILISKIHVFVAKLVLPLEPPDARLFISRSLHGAARGRRRSQGPTIRCNSGVRVPYPPAMLRLFALSALVLAARAAEPVKLDPSVPPDLPAGHSMHGERFNEGPRRRIAADTGLRGGAISRSRPAPGSAGMVQSGRGAIARVLVLGGGAFVPHGAAARSRLHHGPLGHGMANWRTRNARGN